MGRPRVQLQKIENRTYRQISFSKRKTGLIKKAYELSTLSDVELALIIFSPTGKLVLFEGKNRTEEILAHYIEIPVWQCERRLENEEDEKLRRIVSQMRLETGVHRQLAPASNTNEAGQSRGPLTLEEVQKEIFTCGYELEIADKELQYFLKIPNCMQSMVDLECQENILEESWRRLLIHKQYLESTMKEQSCPEHEHLILLRKEVGIDGPGLKIPDFPPLNVPVQPMRTDDAETSTAAMINTFFMNCFPGF